MLRPLWPPTLPCGPSQCNSLAFETPVLQSQTHRGPLHIFTSQLIDWPLLGHCPPGLITWDWAGGVTWPTSWWPRQQRERTSSMICISYPLTASVCGLEAVHPTILPHQPEVCGNGTHILFTSGSSVLGTGLACTNRWLENHGSSAGPWGHRFSCWLPKDPDCSLALESAFDWST